MRMNELIRTWVHKAASGARRDGWRGPFPRNLDQALRSPRWWFFPDGIEVEADPWTALLAAWRQRTRIEKVAASAIDPADFGLPAIPEARLACLRPQAPARLLKLHGRDRFGRRQWLHPAAQAAFQRLQGAARDAGHSLELVSGWRGVAYQAQLLQRKLRRGQDWQEILKLSAPPGYSEHHTGRALDLATDGDSLLEEHFEHTPAYAWLQAHAASFGFRLSYPRGNAEGFAFEPWHWCYVGDSSAA